MSEAHDGADAMAAERPAVAPLDKRVIEIGASVDGPPVVVAKFYRPARWSDEQIVEEHAFTHELASQGIPAVPPLAIDGRTLHRRAGYRFALYPWLGQRPPAITMPMARERLGACIGRMHAAGAVRPFAHRPRLEIALPAQDPRCARCRGAMPTAQRAGCTRVLAEVRDAVRRCVDRAGQPPALRLHGDLRPGTVPWVDAGSECMPQFVDFDEACTGPAVQDLWMWLSGPRALRRAQLGALLAGYERFAPFDRRELHLTEALRTLRLLRQAFGPGSPANEAGPAAAPWGASWCRLRAVVGRLQAQVSAMREPPLEV